MLLLVQCVRKRMPWRWMGFQIFRILYHIMFFMYSVYNILLIIFHLLYSVYIYPTQVDAVPDIPYIISNYILYKHIFHILYSVYYIPFIIFCIYVLNPGGCGSRAQELACSLLSLYESGLYHAMFHFHFLNECD